MSDSPNPFHLFEDVTRRVTGLVPPQAAKHFLNAEKELLLGVAALVDRNGRQGGRASPRGGRRSSTASRGGRRPRHVVVD
jgi:hypothetical protein